MQWDRIEPPMLMFSGGKTHRVPTKGLENFGPYDGGIKINLYILGLQRHIKYTRNIVNSIGNELENRYGSGIDIVEEQYLGKLSIKDYTKTIARIITEWRNDKKRAKLLLHIINKQDKRPNGYYWTLRKIALSKYDGALALPVQTITAEKLKEYHKYYKKGRGIMRNLAISFYAKVGLRPWILAGDISDYYDSAIYVGYDISYRRDIGQKGMGGVVIFDSRGQVIDYFESEMQVEEGDKISDASYRSFLESIIFSAEASKIKPQLIVFHRDGDYYYDEVQKISRYMEQWGYDYIILSFPKRRGGFPLLTTYEKTKLAESGWYTELGWQLAKDGKWYITYGLQSLGSDIPIGVPPNILRFRLIKHKTKIERTKETIKDIAKQVFWLTRLNYATKFGYAKLPITIHYSHKLANVKRNNIALAPFEKIKYNKPIWMI